MSKYNIEVIRLSRSSVGGTSYTGAFLLVDNEAKISFDNGKTIQVAAATLAGEVESITYNGAQIAKIKNTQGQPREALVDGCIKVDGDFKPVKIQWSAGHRSSVAAAFAALWTELQAQGADEITNRQNPKATKVTGGVVVNNSAPQVNKIAQLEEMLNKQQEMMAMLMAQLMAPKAPAPVVVIEEPTDAELEAEEAQLEEMFAAEVEEEATPVEDELANLLAAQAADNKKTTKKGRR